MTSLETRIDAAGATLEAAAKEIDDRVAAAEAGFAKEVDRFIEPINKEIGVVRTQMATLGTEAKSRLDAFKTQQQAAIDALRARLPNDAALDALLAPVRAQATAALDAVGASIESLSA